MTNYRKIHEPIYAAGGVKSATGITVDSGGLTVTAGGATVTAGNITMTAGGIDLPVAVGATGTDLVAYGVSYLTSTASGTYTLATPTVGVHKTVVITGQPTTSATVIVRASTGGAVTLDGTNHIATFSSSGTVGPSIKLVGRTTAAWAIESLYGTAALSTA